MRSLTHIALTAWFVFAMSTSLAAQDRIPWITDLQIARQMAEQQQRLVLLHFYTDSCAPCQRLERYVFNQPELIRSLTTGYIPVKINADQLPQLVDFYKVKSWPMDIVVEPSGREVYRANSPQDANRYIAMLDNVKAHHAIGVAPPEAFTSQPAASSQFAARSDSRLAFDYPPRSSDFLGSQPQNGAAPQGLAGPRPQVQPRPSSVTENPYANPLNQELPQQRPANIAPRYANPYASQAAPAAPSQPAPSPWQTPSQPVAGTYPGAPNVQLPHASAAPGPSLQARDQGRQLERSPWNAPGRAQDNANQNGIPTWQQGVAPANPAPGLPPNNRIASRAGAQFQAPTGTHPPVALDGYCAVSLATKTKWQKGDPRWGAVHRGRTYLFSSPEQQQQFLANPDVMSPILSGYDPVRFIQTGQLVDGKRQHGVFYRDRICLFADEAALHQFSKQPDQYIARALQAMQARN